MGELTVPGWAVSAASSTAWRGWCRCDAAPTLPGCGVLDRGRDLARHADPRVALADLDLGQARARQQLGQILDIGSLDVDLGHCLFSVRFRTGAGWSRQPAGGQEGSDRPARWRPLGVGAYAKPGAVFVSTGTRSCTSLEG